MAFWSESDFRDGPKDCLYSKAIRRNENDDSSDVFAVHVISGVILLVAFVLGVVIGRNRGGRNRAEYSQIS
jgi:ammonia channel protein AmtB